jgi:hypothetical protein
MVFQALGMIVSPGQPSVPAIPKRHYLRPTRLHVPVSGQIRIIRHKRTDHQFTNPKSLHRLNSLVEASRMRSL